MLHADLAIRHEATNAASSKSGGLRTRQGDRQTGYVAGRAQYPCRSGKDIDGGEIDDADRWSAPHG